jgi:hypothetical protein
LLLEGIGELKTSNDIWIRTRNFAALSIVPQPTTVCPRKHCIILKYINIGSTLSPLQRNENVQC